MPKLKLEWMGNDVALVRITGDRKNTEPEHVRIAFPWGDVEVVRATDDDRPDYWVHIRVNQPDANGFFVPGETQAGGIKDARLDQTDKAAYLADTGDFGRPELYHLAVRVGATGGTGRVGR
jgi:hypothetical protein